MHIERLKKKIHVAYLVRRCAVLYEKHETIFCNINQFLEKSLFFNMSKFLRENCLPFV